MTVYTLFLISSITDRVEYGRYGAGFMEIFTKYEGKILAITESPAVLEGKWPYVRNVLLSFPDEEILNAWYRSPEYQVLIQHRLVSSTAYGIVLPGFGEDEDAAKPGPNTTQESA